MMGLVDRAGILVSTKPVEDWAEELNYIALYH